MTIKIRLKNSTVQDKAPLPADLDIGEVAINANAASPAAYIKDTAGAIVKLAGAGAVAADATSTSKGVVQLADAAAVTAGTAGRVVDAAQLKAAVAAEDLWDRAGTEISPKTAGDSVFTSGAVKVGGTTAAPNLRIKADGGIVANTNGLVYDAATKRVGIGTVNPAARLQVSESSTGEVEVARFRIEGQTNNPMLRVLADEANRTVAFDATGSGSGTQFVFKRGGSEAVRIDAANRLLVGASTSYATGGAHRRMQVNGTNVADAALSITRWENANAAPRLILGKSNGALGAFTAVADAEILGQIDFAGANGTDLSNIGASISAFVDGTISGGSTTDLPGRLVFSTTPDGSSSLTERMRIKSSGIINFSNAPVYADNAAAKTGGLFNGDVYRTATGELKIVYT